MHTYLRNRLRIFWELAMKSFIVSIVFSKSSSVLKIFEYLNEICWKLWFLKYFISKKMCPILVGSVHILISQTMTSFTEKIPFSNRCISSLMPNSIKKSRKVSKEQRHQSSFILYEKMKIEPIIMHWSYAGVHYGCVL